MIITARIHGKAWPALTSEQRKDEKSTFFWEKQPHKVCWENSGSVQATPFHSGAYIQSVSRGESGAGTHSSPYIHGALAISGKVVGTEYCSRVLLGSWSWLMTHDVMESVSFHFPHDAVKGEDTKCPSWEPVQLSFHSLQFTTLS